MAETGNFANILAQLEQQVVPTPEDLPAIGEAIRTFRAKLAQVDNLGRSGDEHDLYVLLEALTDAVRGAYPGSICRSGCSGCCESSTAVFDASPGEWALIETHMAEQWSEEQREALKQRWQRDHGHQLRAYRLLSLIRYFEPVMDAYFARHPYRCPFLVDGRCSIYQARPLACRMYGYFAIRSRWYEPSAVYACNKQSAYFRSLREKQALHLPSANTVVARSKRFTRGVGRILPLWIARMQGAAGRPQSL